MKIRAENQQCVGRRGVVVPAVMGAAGKTSLHTRAPRCNQRKHRQLHDEAAKQVTDAVEEIVRANVERAKAGSLTHTRWLFSLMEALEEEQSPESAKRKSLAEILIEQLKSKQ